MLKTESISVEDKISHIFIIIKMTYQVNSSDINVAYNPPQTPRFVLTSRIPVITLEEINNSIIVLNKVRQIFAEILTEHDLQLISNILDTSQKIILSAPQLKELICTMLNINTDGIVININDIKIKFSEDILSSCLKTSVSPFKNIISIKVLEQDISQTEPDIFSALSNFKISTEVFYESIMKKEK